MAQVPYSAASEVSPETRAPDDYQHINVNPGEFGAAIGEGVQQLGQGAMRAVHFFGEVAADDRTNQLYDRWNKRLYGDPNKTVPGPDGQPQPDQGYFGLKGRAALDARPVLEKDMDADLKQFRQGLKTPEEQLQFDRDTRRYRILVSEKVGSHATQQSNIYAANVNNASADLAKTHIANNADSDEEFKHGWADLTRSYVKNAQLQGGGTEQLQAASDKAARDALSTRLQAIAVHDPSRAMRMLDANRTVAGTEYDNLAASFRQRSEHQNGIAGGQRHLSEARAGYPYAVATQPEYSAAAAAVPGGFSPNGLARTAQIESGGNPNARTGSAQGLMQFMPGTWTKYGQGSPFDPQQSILAAARYSADNAKVLKGALGRDATDAELYIAHQQGAGGAVKLFANPNVRAGDLVGDAAIAANGGDPNAPASAFTSMWAARFNRSVPAPAANYGGEQTLWMKPEAQAGFVSPWPQAGTSAIPFPNVASALVSAPPPPAGPASVRTDAYQRVLDDKSMNDNEKQVALKFIGERMQIEHAAAVDQERVRKLQQQETKDRSDAQEKEYIKRLYGPGSQVSALDAAKDPLLTREASERVIGFIERKAKADPAAEVSRASTVDLLRRIRLPEGDPQKINDMRPVDDAFFNQHVTKTDHDFLEKELKGGGTFLGKRQADFIKSVAPMIDRSPLDPLDVSGKQRLYVFERAVDTRVSEYEKAGKNPMDLFDPSKPDYLGKPETIAAYAPTLQDSAARFANQPPPSSAARPPVSIPTAPALPDNMRRIPGETLDQWARRTGHGFSGRPAAAGPQVPMSH